ncbi:MAG: agmatine deiminase family protein [Xanthomonadaceae bacterium]|nr:agmatine deiminase family protein [Xanthomonadaceae bacterium]
MNRTAFRLPAEWEPQDAILVAWPHAGTDWAPRLPEVEIAYVALVSAIARFERVVICVADPDLRRRAGRQLAAAGVQPSQVHFVELAYDDTWLRDSGPVTLVDESRGRFLLDDFRFTGWGGKYAAERDDALIDGLQSAGLFAAADHQRIEFALEGGAIEADGHGSLLTTWRCLHQRHPRMERSAIESRLRQTLHATRVLWLEHGYLEGDDTDAHIDTLARFAPDGSIVYQACDVVADPHHAELARMRDDLAALRDIQARSYPLRALPWAQPIREGSRRLAASYANYLVVNGGVLVPAYGDPADAAAAAIIGDAHPGREIVQVPCRPLIGQNGSLHCVTMQLPRGVLA